MLFDFLRRQHSLPVVELADVISLPPISDGARRVLLQHFGGCLDGSVNYFTGTGVIPFPKAEDAPVAEQILEANAAMADHDPSCWFVDFLN